MTDTSQTSRGWLIDAVNLICEQIALASHCQELINTYTNEMGNEDDEVSIQALVSKIQLQEQILKTSLSIRREVMSRIYQTHPWDHNNWCSLKHAIGAYWYATECMYANPDDVIWQQFQQKCYGNMVGVLWLFCGLDELILCSRCLEDELAGKKE